MDEEKQSLLARHHSVAIKQIHEQESQYTAGNVKLLVPENTSKEHVEGDYKVRSTETHVIKVKQDDSGLFRQRILQVSARLAPGSTCKIDVYSWLQEAGQAPLPRQLLLR